MTTTNDPHITAIRQQVSTSYEELQQLLDKPIATLPPARLYQPPAADEWTIMENLAHIVEFMPYWAEEIAQLVSQPGKQFGRTTKHAGRLNAIKEHSPDTLEQAKAQLPASYARLDQVLSSLHDQDLALVGHHPKLGAQTLAWFIDDFVTRHLANHVAQIKEIIQQVVQ